jgi:hypothetical protein
MVRAYAITPPSATQLPLFVNHFRQLLGQHRLMLRDRILFPTQITRKMATIANLQRLSAAKLSSILLEQQPGDKSKLAVIDVRDDGLCRAVPSTDQ